MKVKSEREVAQSCPTLATSWTAAHQAPQSMGFSVLEWSAIAFSELFSLANPKCDEWNIATTHTLFDLFFP